MFWLFITLAVLVVVVLATVLSMHSERRKKEDRANAMAMVLGRTLRPLVKAESVETALEFSPVVQDASFFSAVRKSPFDALGNLQKGDIDSARAALQKLAYEVHAEKKRHPDRVAQFTTLMCLFVREDPLFWQGLNAVKPLIEKTPGVFQTALYEHMHMDIEMARYVLYFANETGHLVRQKKGNSYKVYLPGQEVSVVLPTKRARKKAPT
nr:hypothetical protein [uncultured Albidiferax sp.]